MLSYYRDAAIEDAFCPRSKMRFWSTFEDAFLVHVRICVLASLKMCFIAPRSRSFLSYRKSGSHIRKMLLLHIRRAGFSPHSKMRFPIPSEDAFCPHSKMLFAPYQQIQC
ncbi:hypothetical protein AVEN_242437-1 [Araneus ventricosus]|uniref:Uncharacterized protein n=1 Tax=Araneus ventricosus TaxID=182803 RepID=A0A4Y2LI00_ARAVE|nr:hypothetical protein AVEN_242437-1 [Araneus ventricosus]